MQGAKCAISKLMCGLSVCTDDNHSLKIFALSSRTHGRNIHLLTPTPIMALSDYNVLANVCQRMKN